MVKPGCKLMELYRVFFELCCLVERAFRASADVDWLYVFAFILISLFIVTGVIAFQSKVAKQNTRKSERLKTCIMLE
jgi:hypothetical protein